MKTNPKIEIRPESLGVTYTEHGSLKPLSRSKHANRSIHLVPSEGFSSRIRDKPSNKIASYIVLRYKKPKLQNDLRSVPVLVEGFSSDVLDLSNRSVSKTMANYIRNV